MDEVPIATNTIIGGIKSSSSSGEVVVDKQTGLAKVNDNVTMAGSGVIVLNGVGLPDGPHTIEFDGEPPMASDIGYDNTTSHLTADTMQSAIDDVNAKADGVSDIINIINNKLVNVDDLLFEVSGWTVEQSVFSVTNGVLCGSMKIKTTTPSNITVTSNYNIPQYYPIGVGIFTGSTTITSDIILYNHVITNTIFTEVCIVFSVNWDESFTKKEST